MKGKKNGGRKDGGQTQNKTKRGNHQKKGEKIKEKQRGVMTGEKRRKVARRLEKKEEFTNGKCCRRPQPQR